MVQGIPLTIHLLSKLNTTIFVNQLKNLVLPESGILEVNYEIVTPWIVSIGTRIFTHYDCLVRINTELSTYLVNNLAVSVFFF